MRRVILAGMVILGCVAGWAADYATDGADPGRTGWVKGEKVFNKTDVKTMKLLWKVHLDGATRQMHNTFPPLVLDGVTTTSGSKEIAVISGISDDLWAFDTATGKQLWHKHFDSTYDEGAAVGVEARFAPADRQTFRQWDLAAARENIRSIRFRGMGVCAR